MPRAISAEEAERLLDTAEHNLRLQWDRECKATWTRANLRAAELQEPGTPYGAQRALDAAGVGQVTTDESLPALDEAPTRVQIAEVLARLQFYHEELIATATTEEQLHAAFIPLHVARCLFDFAPLKLRPPSKIKRALDSESMLLWRSHASPNGSSGRPRGTADTPARRLLDSVISCLCNDMAAPPRELLAWLLARGSKGEPGQRGKPPDGRCALIEALQAELRAMGATEDEIKDKSGQFRSAIDNARRNSRARKTNCLPSLSGF